MIGDSVLSDEIRAGIERRLVPGFPKYSVTSDGAVWSRKRAHDGTGGYRWVARKGVADEDGYLRYGLYHRGSPRSIAGHSIVLTAFVGPRPDGMVCCHNNGIRSDNRLENLRWDTPKANSEDRSKHGMTAYGEAVGTSKLSEQDVLNVRRLSESGLSRKIVGLMCGLSSSQVSRIARGVNWTSLDSRRQLRDAEDLGDTLDWSDRALAADYERMVGGVA